MCDDHLLYLGKFGMECAALSLSRSARSERQSDFTRAYCPDVESASEIAGGRYHKYPATAAQAGGSQTT
jgi:hypothetical protein